MTQEPEPRSFGELLSAEREALRSADVERLVELQVAKRQALDALHAAGQVLPPELIDLAALNVELMHHLVASLRGIVASDGSAVYGKGGDVQITEGTSRRHGAA
ncbi:MAG: hypothetical protein AAGE52_19950 [Myxococcota bacterium]